MTKPLHVFSEIGKLKTVLVHRPGKEVENLIPDHLSEFLFDDIPFLAQAQKEHDAFVAILQSRGVEVVYLTDLVMETLQEEEIRHAFIQEYLTEAQLYRPEWRERVEAFLAKETVDFAFVERLMAGIQVEELLSEQEIVGLKMEGWTYPFIIDPMPNLYFTRDNFATIGHGISLNHMHTNTRNRETLFADYIFRYHPRFREHAVPLVYSRQADFSMEGGDQLVLSPEVLAVGISQRTEVEAIKELARHIFEEEMGFRKILAIDIGQTRKFMHLDTVFTMVDYQTFTIHPEIEEALIVYVIEKGQEGLTFRQETQTLDKLLAEHLGLEQVELIRCGGGNRTAAAREQWNDGSNTLAIAPGEVIVYDRNPITNQLLREAGIQVHTFSGSELVRGRGGPRCMSMPLVREALHQKGMSEYDND